MASLGEKTWPYAFDAVEVKHRETVVTTIVNSPVFDGILSNMDDSFAYDVGYIPNGYENRPDLISNLFYGSPKYWWLLMLVNNITDPNEGFKLNERILIPKM